MSANIRTGCRWECRHTWHGDHGPNRSIPGTYGGPGDVRECEHGRLWQWERLVESCYFTTHDRWRRISRIWEPLTYRRAQAALTTDHAKSEPEEPSDA